MNKTAFGLPQKREQVISVLQDAFAENNLEEDEYERRLQIAFDAKSIEDLEHSVYDFPNKNQLFPSVQMDTESTKQTYVAPEKGKFGKSLKPMNAILSGKKMSITQSYFMPITANTILGESRIDCKEMVPQSMNIPFQVNTVLGETRVDLRNMQLEGRTVHLHLNTFLGETRIMLPKGAIVHNMSDVILGEFHEKDRRNTFMKKINKLFTNDDYDTEPEPPECNFSVVVSGYCVLGNVTIRYY